MKKIFVPTGALLDKEMNKGGYMWDKFKALDRHVQIAIVAVIVAFGIASAIWG